MQHLVQVILRNTKYISPLLRHIVTDRVRLSVHISGGGGTQGTPLLGKGAPPCWPPPHRSNIACTCYAAVAMPLAFTQEDFLVV